MTFKTLWKRWHLKCYHKLSLESTIIHAVYGSIHVNNSIRYSELRKHYAAIFDKLESISLGYYVEFIIIEEHEQKKQQYFFPLFSVQLFHETLQQNHHLYRNLNTITAKSRAKECTINHTFARHMIRKYIQMLLKVYGYEEQQNIICSSLLSLGHSLCSPKVLKVATSNFQSATNTKSQGQPK